MFSNASHLPNESDCIIGVSPAELRVIGFNVRNFVVAFHDGQKADDLISSGRCLLELSSAGYTAKMLRDAGYSCKILRASGLFSHKDMICSGFSAHELRVAGLTAEQLFPDFSADDLRAAGNTKLYNCTEWNM